MAKGIKGSTKKKTYSYALELFSNAGYSLVSKEYMGSRIPLHSICPKGHDYFVPLTLFENRKFRCPECSGNKPYTLEKARAEFLSRGCNPIFTEYRKNTIPLKTECPNGHSWLVTLNNLQKKGVHCPKCSNFVVKHNIEYVRNFFNSEGYELISDIYIDSGILLNVKCPKRHDWQIRFGDFYNSGYRCPGCSEKGASKAENELMGIIKNIYPKTQKFRDRKVKIEGKPYIKGFDIDIFVPEINMGIEFDGIYHHSIGGLKRGRPNWPDQDLLNYHAIKDSWFLQKNIQILHIYEKNWLDNKQSCIEKCLCFLGVK